MRERSLFHTSLIANLVSLLLVTALVAGSVFVSLRRSVTIWNVNRGQRLENLILPILADVYRAHGNLHPDRIHDQLRHILTANVYAYVFDTEGVPTYLYSLGRRTPLYDREGVLEQLARLRNADRPLTPVVDGSDVVGYLSADTVGFTHDAANRRFLMSITDTVITGSIAAVFIALGAAWLFSSKLAKQARSVAAGLRGISAGRRDVSFAPTHTRELREISDSAVKLQGQLLREERLRQQWMEDIAHDLRTPVAALKSQIEGMAEGFLSLDSERLNRLHDEVGHVEWLVAGLRELSQVESPDTQIVYSTVSPCALVRNVVTGLAVSAEEHVHAVQIRCVHDVTVRADEHLLRRALENVIANASEHVTEGGDVAVTITADAGEELCVIDIANSGHVEPAEIPRFFDRLYQGKTNTRRSGSGLGLPIAKSIVERHGGTVDMHQRGSFTHVVLSLPLVATPVSGKA